LKELLKAFLAVFIKLASQSIIRIRGALSTYHFPEYTKLHLLLRRI
jgi:hypothetical protein